MLGGFDPKSALVEENICPLQRGVPESLDPGNLNRVACDGG